MSVVVDKRLALLDSMERTFTAYESDFFGFCSDVLGYSSKIVNRRDLNEKHRLLCSKLSNSGKRFKLFLLPRHTFKSNIVSIGYSLWRIMKNPDIRILLYSDASAKAEGFLSGIKSHILGKVIGSVWRENLGKWETDPRKGKWNDSEIIVSTRKNANVEPTVETAGIGTSLTGRHFDLIIFDDIVSDINVTTKEQMDKVAECYRKGLSLLAPDGMVIMVGTRWHFGDLYGRIIEDNKTNFVFDIMIEDAEERLPDGKLVFESIGLTEEFLKFQKASQGSALYSALYRNSPTDDETCLFRYNLFSFYGNIKNEDLYVTCACDPAGEGDDFTAVTIVGTDSNMDLYILHAVQGHWTMPEIIEKLIRLNYQYRYKVLGIEENFYHGALSREFENRCTQERYEPGWNNFTRKEIKSARGTGKMNRIRGLQSFHERGGLKFPGDSYNKLDGGFSVLADQMSRTDMNGVKARHDDLLDSLSMHLDIMQRGTGTPKDEDFPYLSPAWLEKQYWDKLFKENNSRPRFARDKIIYNPTFC